MSKKIMEFEGLRPVKFTFAMDVDDDILNGWTNDTYWNGFLNVQVSQETHKRLSELYGEELNIPVNENGLIDYGGGAACTVEYKP